MPQEIVEIVSAFKENNSPGFDDVSPPIIKTVIVAAQPSAMWLYLLKDYKLQ